MERKENDREDRDERVETEICITTALTMGLSENLGTIKGVENI